KAREVREGGGVDEGDACPFPLELRQVRALSVTKPRRALRIYRNGPTAGSKSADYLREIFIGFGELRHATRGFGEEGEPRGVVGVLVDHADFTGSMVTPS